MFHAYNSFLSRLLIVLSVRDGELLVLYWCWVLVRLRVFVKKVKIKIRHQRNGTRATATARRCASPLAFWVPDSVAISKAQNLFIDFYVNIVDRRKKI